MPNLTNGNYNVAAAERVLQEDGLKLGGVYGPSKTGVVVQTLPEPGVTVPYGSPVDIYTA
jgi:beta-lactam-binding protein with PASTA domain